MTDPVVLLVVALAGALIGVVGAMVFIRRTGGEAGRQTGGDMLAVDFQQVLDLLRRVHGAQAACVVTDEEFPTVATGDPRPAQSVLDRATGIARAARDDGRDHILPGAPEIIAVGNGRLGVALVMPPGQRSPADHQRIAADVHRLVASFRVARGGTQMLRADPQEALDGALSRLESVEGLATALCEAARAMSGLPTAIAIRDPVTNAAIIVAVSRVSDHRLIGSRVTADSACGRALMGRMPTVGNTITELLGDLPGDRRRRDEPGVAFPLHDGREGIGALVVFGQPDSIDPAVRGRIGALGLEMSPHLSAAAAVRAAETRSLTDELTGLPNRLVLERVMSQIGNRPGALLVAQVDSYRKVIDGFGHPAGEAMVKHIGLLLARTLRDGDLAARNGEEEFALWLVGAGKTAAVDVAERVRKAVAAETLRWAGVDLKLTCSIGLASYPDTARDLADLRLAAGAASRQARDAGGNRVAVASAPPPAAG